MGKNKTVVFNTYRHDSNWALVIDGTVVAGENTTYVHGRKIGDYRVTVGELERALGVKIEKADV